MGRIARPHTGVVLQLVNGQIELEQDNLTTMAPDDGAPTATAEVRPGETPAATGDLPANAEQIQGRLREKEQLVAALTERLEQAAEQLDRLRRTGIDKGRRPLG